MNIKVFGAGCSSCNTLYNNVYEAVDEMGLDVEVNFVHDITKALEYDILQMPALVINEKVISYGKNLTVDEIKKILEDY